MAHKKRIKKYILDFILNGLLGLMIFTSGEYLYYRLMPATIFFEYKEVVTVKNRFKVGEEIRLKTTSVYFRPMDISWNDILYCKFGGDLMTLYSTQSSQSDDFTPERGLGVMGSTEWIYLSGAPKEPTECFVDSTITAHLSFGIKKSINVQSNKFYIN